MFAPRLLWFGLLVASTVTLSAQAPTAKSWWGGEVATALQRSGDNLPEIRKALATAPIDHREEVAFLVTHMPTADLRRLKAAFILANVALAKAALAKSRWGKSIPRAVFLNDVLPYANVSETREAWRRDFYARFYPLVKNCKTAGEAAQVLNARVFALLKVRYSTGRRRADQSPSESAAIGMASCTGLSIILADACRAVGVPARLVGIPNWVGKRGNHTWVEVWDGEWRFTGAAEPSGAGLNHAWFVGDAAKALVDDPKHSIYAVSYRRTGVAFPMAWARGAERVSAVNVTARYARKAKAQGTVRLMVRVCAASGGPRIVADVVLSLVAKPGIVRRGKSRGERSDTNDFLTFDVEPNRAYVIRVVLGERSRRVEHRTDRSEQQLVDITMSAAKQTEGK